MDAIPDDALELILLFLDSQVSLLRAAATCRRWHRIVACDVFLRRFGSLHKLAAVVAGSYRNSMLLERPRFEPSPRSVDVDSGHFSLDFLPNKNNFTFSRWRMADSHGSLLLLDRENCSMGTRDFVVCEPLTRRYRVISPPAAASPSHFSQRALLLDGGDGAEEGTSSSIGMSNFRVMCLLHDGVVHIHSDLFTTGGSWRAVDTNQGYYCRFIGLASGSVYFRSGRTVLTLDRGATEFSPSLLPYDPVSSLMTVAVGRDGEPRIVDLGGGTGYLKVYARRRGEGGKWTGERIIQLTAAMLNVPLLDDNRWYFRDCGVQIAGTVVTRVCTGYGSSSTFRIDMETMEVERLPNMDTRYPTMLPWPPTLHHACTDHAAC